MQAWQAIRSARTNPLWLLLLSALAVPNSLYGQSADQLLQDTAKNYQTLTNYELAGHANVAIPGSVWQFTGDFTLIGPRKESSQDGGPPKMTPGASRVGGLKLVKTAPDSTEQPPSSASFPFALFMQFGAKIADEVVGVERSGSETLKLNGEDVACDILKVTYRPSTYEHPHPESVSYWISPAKHLVLKEVLTFNAGRHIDHAVWTITFDSVKFGRPKPQWVLDMADIPAVKERREWIGEAAPGFTLPASDGASVTLTSLRGKEVLLDFWSTLCGPCKLEMPMIEEVGREYEGRGVVLVGISFDPTEKSKAWLDRNHRTLRTLTDFDFIASDAYKVHGIPALVLIGRDGKVKQYWEGSVSKATIEAALNSSLKRKRYKHVSN
jgi:peroxiredoxin